METFWQVLEKWEIQIPIIQRDYAQGRKSEERIAQKFISDIHNALQKKAS